MKNSFTILTILTFSNSCISGRMNPEKQVENSRKTENSLTKDNDGKQIDSLTNRVIADFSAVNRDSIIDDAGKFLYLFESFSIKDSLIEFYGDTCYDVGFNLKCYQNEILLFCKTITKKDFYSFFKTNKQILNKYVLTSCDLDKVTRNPLNIQFRLNICKPASADCFNFILNFDSKGNCFIIPDEERNNESM